MIIKSVRERVIVEKKEIVINNFWLPLHLDFCIIGIIGIVDIIDIVDVVDIVDIIGIISIQIWLKKCALSIMSSYCTFKKKGLDNTSWLFDLS